jgi:hypothetical protein
LPNVTLLLNAEVSITGADLAEISDDDGNAYTYGGVSYTAVKVAFDVSGVIGTITRLDLYADGYGTYFEPGSPPTNLNGRKFYIWKYAATAAYELLASDAAGSALNVITGAITANVSNYISGNVVTAYHCSDDIGAGTSTIYTDRLNLVVTYTPAAGRSQGHVIGLWLLAAAAWLFLAGGCGLFTKPQPTIREMQAAVDQAVKAQLAPVITAQGDADVKLTTIQNTVSKVQQGQNALDQKVGTIGTQTIVSTDPKVLAEIRQGYADTITALNKLTADIAANRLKLTAKVLVLGLGVVLFCIFLPITLPDTWMLAGCGLGMAMMVGSSAAMLL